MVDSTGTLSWSALTHSRLFTPSGLAVGTAPLSCTVMVTGVVLSTGTCSGNRVAEKAKFSNTQTLSIRSH